MNRDGAIEAARRRRKELHAAMIDAEAALQAPAAAGSWRAMLLAELRDLLGALDDHIEVVEGPDGIIESAVDDAPRLSAQGARLRAEHPALRLRVVAAIEAVERAADPPDDATVETIRDETLAMLGALSRHRQQGSDFVWEAYDVDIGGQS